MPEKALVTAIISQALNDLFNPDYLVTPAERDQALALLTDHHGEWAEARRDLCHVTDYDPDILRERVIAILTGKEPPAILVETRPDKKARCLQEARALWANRKPRFVTTPLPTIKPAPPAIDPADIDVIIPDDPFFVSGTGHIRASRRWKDGEVSRFLGPLPPIHSHLGEALWVITQAHRAGAHSLHEIGGDGPALIDALRKALPTCEICWSSQGQRLPDYRPAAGLRVYLKQLAKAA